jgi:hypothetical protein
MWSRALKDCEVLREEYKLVGKNYDNQRIFRKRWATKQAEALKHTREQTQAIYDVDEQSGQYEPPMRIVVLEGGDKSAHVAASHYCARALFLTRKGITFHGKPFVSWNDWTKRYEFLYVKKSFQTRFEQCWKEKVEYLAKEKDGVQAAKVGDAGRDAVVGAGGSSDGDGGAGDPPTQGRTKPQEKEKENKKKENESPGDKKKADHRKDMLKIWKAASVLKDRWSSASAQYHSLGTAIDHDAVWVWARGYEKNELDAIFKVMDKYKDKSATGFWYEWSLQDIQVLKKHYEENAVIKEMKMADEVSGAIEKLEMKIKILKGMQVARLQVQKK